MASNEGISKYGYYLYRYLKNRVDLSLLQLRGFRRPPNSNHSVYHLLNQNLTFLFKKDRFILTVQDLIPLLYPSKILEKYWRRYLYSGITQAELIIVPSENTRQDLLKFYNPNPEKVIKIHLGYNPQIFYPRPKKSCRRLLGLPLDKTIILNVGTETPRKNILTLLKAIQDRKDTVFIRIGKQKIKDSFASYISGDLSESLLSLFYNSADLYVSPSLYEGFGLTPLEALACNVPTIVGNNSSLREIYSGWAILCDVSNPDSLRTTIDNTLEWQESLFDWGKINKFVKQYTWERTAQLTYDKVYSVIPGCN